MSVESKPEEVEKLNALSDKSQVEKSQVEKSQDDYSRRGFRQRVFMGKEMRENFLGLVGKVIKSIECERGGSSLVIRLDDGSSCVVEGSCAVKIFNFGVKDEWGYGYGVGDVYGKPLLAVNRVTMVECWDGNQEEPIQIVRAYSFCVQEGKDWSVFWRGGLGAEDSVESIVESIVE